jgi:alpha-D-ribose 1-methylphosphonate 5-triphosphate diphosphatase PhnM
MGQIWYEKYKEDIQNKYNLSEDQFNTLLSELQKRNPRLISLQRSRTKTWFALRDV